VLALTNAVVSTADNDSSTPKVSNEVVFRPRFVSEFTSLWAGTAFVVKVTPNSEPVVLTAYHLFGPNGGLDKLVPPDRLADYVLYAELYPAFDEKAEGFRTGPMLPILDVGVLGTASRAGDVSAFRGNQDLEKWALPLAKKNPKEGERVWLLAQLAEGSDATLHRATALGVDEEDDFIIQYDDSNIALRATSGAAILNERGEVVAINLGGTKNEGVVYGYTNPVERFRPSLVRAIEAYGAD
jgi:hypothetical protein